MHPNGFKKVAIGLYEEGHELEPTIEDNYERKILIQQVDWKWMELF
jgi:hypothetical protein